MFDQSFSKKYRLLKKNDFLNLKEGSLCLKNSSLITYYKKREGDPICSRLGISCSKKVGKSVQRNRVKRLIKEYFRKSPFKEFGVDFLLVVKTQEKSKDIHIIKKQEESLLKNLENVFKNVQKGKPSFGKVSTKIN